MESLRYDVVVVGAGPAGLSCAIRLKQRAPELGVCVLEKGAEVGAHILSGAVFDPRALHELLPHWPRLGAPAGVEVVHDEFHWLPDASRARRVPAALLPPSLANAGCRILSLGLLCRWLAQQAEALGVEIFPGFAAVAPHFDGDGAVAGVVTGAMGIARDGSRKPGWQEGMLLQAGQTVLAEGCRGQLAQRLIEDFDLARQADPQHYAIGLKELWEIPAPQHRPGTVLHGTGWPLPRDTGGGFFLYHGAQARVAVGLIVDLNYRNPWLSPYEEFQRFKHHPLIAPVLRGGRRIAYGARAISKGGLGSLPRMHLPGALLVGCAAGTLDVARIKGSHTAMRSGMLAADSIADAAAAGPLDGRALADFDRRLHADWLGEDLRRGRNFGPALHRFGRLLGGAFNLLDQRLRGRLPLRLRDPRPDHLALAPAADCRKPHYPAPDGVLSFDRPGSVYLSGTAHEHDQPCHLQLRDPALPVELNLPRYGAPEQRYCPAGVYEIVEDAAGPRLQINAQNCVHCKTCDIKDPRQNIRWLAPEGGGGPNYAGM